MPAKSQLLFHIPTLPGRFPNPESQTPANPPSYSHLSLPFWLPVYLEHTSVIALIATV